MFFCKTSALVTLCPSKNLIRLETDVSPCSSCCWISPTGADTMQRFPKRAARHATALPCLRFLMTKCIENNRPLSSPLNPRHSRGRFCGSGRREFRRLTKQLLLALHWLVAMLFRRTGKRLCESTRLDQVAQPSVHLLTEEHHISRGQTFIHPLSSSCTLGKELVKYGSIFRLLIRYV